MKLTARAATYACMLSISAPAFAGPNWLLQPVQAGQETIRYQKGVPTLDLELPNGVVQVTPLTMDHGSLAFGVAVYNDSRQPANFGIENVGVTFEGAARRVFSKDDLVKQAKNRAAWSQFGIALLGGLAAGAAASQRNYYNSSFITPRGTYFSSFSAPSLAGQLQANSIARSTGWGIASIQFQLDRTVEMLGDQVLQTTTVYPGESYAGKVVLAKVQPKQWPAQIQITLNWNGDAYPFTFQIAKPGTPAPMFTAITRQSDLIDFRKAAAAQQQPAVLPSEAPTLPPTVVAAAYRGRTQAAASAAAESNHGLNPNGHIQCITCR